MKIKLIFVFLCLINSFSALGQIVNEIVDHLAIIEVKEGKSILQTIFEEAQPHPRLIKGRDFNSLFIGKYFIKLVTANEDSIENQYQSGFCIKTKDLNPENPNNNKLFDFADIFRVQGSKCSEGYDHLRMRIVTIPDNANVYIGGYGIFRADEICFEDEEKGQLERASAVQEIRELLDAKLLILQQKNMLSRLDYYKAFLPFVSLQKGNFQEAYFYETNLMGAQLAEANFQGAQFNKTSLYKIKASMANFQETYFSNVDLTEAQVSGANFQEAEICKSSLRQIKAPNVNFQGATLDECDLSMAELRSLTRFSNIRDDLSRISIQFSHIKTQLLNNPIRLSTISIELLCIHTKLSSISTQLPASSAQLVNTSVLLLSNIQFLTKIQLLETGAELLTACIKLLETSAELLNAGFYGTNLLNTNIKNSQGDKDTFKGAVFNERLENTFNRSYDKKRPMPTIIVSAPED